MNKLLEQENKIRNIIYEIRSKQVMLDSDLAKLYGYTQGTKALNQAVKRNMERFPDDFYFQITKDELNILRSQIVTAKTNMNKLRTLPFVFTEQGVAMLSSILKIKNAVLINVGIMRAFVAMRHYVIKNKDIYQSLNNLNNEIMNHKQILIEHNHKFEQLFSNFKQTELKEKIFFKVNEYRENIKRKIKIDEKNADSLGADFYEIEKFKQKDLSRIALL